MIECSWKENFGIECLTCGFQRSFWLLLKGDLMNSISTFPATIPFLLTILITVLHLKFKFRIGTFWILGMFVTTVTLISVNYIVKIINGDVFV